MKEIEWKRILVRVGARFELARVRVIGSRLYKIDLVATQKTYLELEWKRMEWKHKGKSFLLRHQQRKALVC